jgi:cellulose synthase/poly-beta-1,6-N-acetylglucosamine synthase-like glycosyltransferase
MFSRLQELEFAGLVLCGAGLIGSGAPMICNGANIAYRKQLFFDVGGFSAERAYTSGDDELLMRKIHERGNQKVVFCFEHDALVSTPANSSIGQFMAQRRRWASKSANYPVGFMLHTLVPVFLFYAGLVCLSIAALLTLQLDAFAFFFLLMMVKSIFEYQVLRFGKHLLNLRITAAQFLLAELLQPFYIVIATIAGLFIGYRWKGREVSR